jgi:osmoprotectant transport system permease protein
MHFSRRSFVAGLALTAACSKRSNKLVVGSKNTTEQSLFGEIIALHLERRLGHPVERKPSLPGTQLAHDSIVGGGIDLYVEYTAAAYSVVIREEPSKDPAIALERLKQQYSRSFLCEWLDPLGVDSAYIVAASKASAEAGKLVTLSDAAESKNEFRLASSIEFQERSDGLPALSSYRIRWKSAPRALENERLYRLLQDGQVDMLGVNCTDGRLEKVEHVILTDDKNVFHPQRACIVVRQDALKNEPLLQKSLSELSGKFSNGQMRDWNYKVDVIRLPVKEVAREFLRINP